MTGEIKPKIHYDPVADVILLDYYPGTVLTEAMFAYVISEATAIARKLPHPVFALANLQDVAVDEALQKTYGTYTGQMLKVVRGVVRYNANNLITSVTIRSSAVRDHMQDMQSHIYPTREAALAAIQELSKAKVSQDLNTSVAAPRPLPKLENKDSSEEFYYSNPLHTLTWHKQARLIHSVQKGFIEGELFQLGLAKILELIKDKQLAKILIDIRERNVVGVADQNKLAKEWLPVAVESGLRYIAYLTPQNALGQMSLNRLTSQFKEARLELAYFDDETEARNWLNTK